MVWSKMIAFVLLPLCVIVAAFFVHPFAGIIGIVLYAGYIYWNGKPRLYAYLGSVQYAKGNLEQALLYYEKANQSPSIKPNQRIGYGYLLLRKGDLEQAKQVMRSVLKKKLNRDETIVAYSNYALVQWKEGDLDGAIHTLEETLAKYKHSTLYSSLGYFLIEKGDLERALAFNQEAYAYNDSDPAIMDHYAFCLYLKGELKEAEKMYEKAVAKNPRFPEVYYNYGLVLLALEKFDDAEQLFKKSLQMKPSLRNAVSKEKVEKKLQEIEKKRSLVTN